MKTWSYFLTIPKLTQSLSEREVLVNALQESKNRERARSDELAAVLDAVPIAVFISRDPQALRIAGNRLSYEWIQLPVGANFSKSAPEGGEIRDVQVI